MLSKELLEKTVAEAIDSRAFSDFCGVDSSNQVPDGDTLGRRRYTRAVEDGAGSVEDAVAQRLRLVAAATVGGRDAVDDELDMLVVLEGHRGLLQQARALVEQTQAATKRAFNANGSCPKPDQVLLKLANKPAIMWLKSVSLIPPPAMTSNMTAASTCRLLVERFTKTTTAGYAIWIKISSLICQPAPICNYA